MNVIETNSGPPGVSVDIEIIGAGGPGTKILVNGTPIEGVIAVALNASVPSRPTVTLVLRPRRVRVKADNAELRTVEGAVMKRSGE